MRNVGFTSSVALLRRKNWARITFIVILTFGIFWQVAGLVMQFAIFSDFPLPPEGKGFEAFELMSNIIRWFSFAMALAISGLFVWVIKKLTSQPIIEEFTLNNSSNSDDQKTAVSS